jgi:hypothetical protein
MESFMRIILAFIPLFISASALAQSPSVSLTSFRYTGTETTAAELCGKVTGAAGNEMVQINVDLKSKTPAHYTTAVSDDGSFCVVVSTITGEATAAMKGEPHLEQAMMSAEAAQFSAPRPPIRNWVCRAHAFDSNYPDYGGFQSASRYTAEQNAIYSCQLYQKKRCVAGSCHQQ